MILDTSVAEPILVAHRGDAARHPENTLAAFASAARLGVYHVELDVQLTADGVALVLHDATLARTHGLDVVVPATGVKTLETLGVLTGGNRPPHIPRLAELAAWMQRCPPMRAFVEIKKESLGARGRQHVLDTVEGDIRTLRGRATMISYDARILAMARRKDWPIGYVLENMSLRYRRIAERLAPEYLFADINHILRAGKLWPGTWHWAAFEAEAPGLAAPLAALGVRYLETMNPAAFLPRGAAGQSPP